MSATTAKRSMIGLAAGPGTAVLVEADRPGPVVRAREDRVLSHDANEAQIS